VDIVDALRDGIQQLKDALLTADMLAINAPDDLSQRQELLITSFVILAHAHIEEFIENLFLSYIEKREMEIRPESAPHCFVRLSLHFSGDLIGQGVGKAEMANLCKIAKNLYISKVIKINNGLKSANLIALAKPLGLHLQIADRCDRLFPVLNTLGAKRGRMAHTSAAQAATETVYALQAVAWVDDVSDHIGQLVEYLDTAR
jgi:hypothetical protein